MIQKTKRPISILLVLLMIVGMFSVLPISAGATSYDSGSITFSNLQVGDTVSVGVSCFEGCPTTLVLKGGTYGVNASEGRVEQICNEDLSAFIDPDGYGFYNDSERIFVYEWANPSNRYFLCNQDGTLSTQMVVLAKEGNTQDGVTLTVGGYDPASVPVDYYVVGTMNSWAISEDYKMVLNENNTSEYWIQNVPLHSGDEIKVVSSTDGSTVQYWYPDGTDNNLAIGEDGYYNVYVAPAGHNTWHYNCILATKQSDLNYVAQIGTTKYETLADAFAAAVDGDTITLLADCAGNGIKVTPAGKFATNGLTVDFAGHTYTVDGETVGSTGTETNGFQLLKNNKVTFQNGTITSAKAKILVQNYSDLTLDGMTLTLNNPNYASAYTLSNNNGNIVIDDTTINANPAGGFAFDVCRYASYPSVHVTVTGNSVINGDVEIFASKGDAKDGFSLTLESGSMSGDIVVDASAQALVGEDNKVTKADTFTQEAPEGYEWVDNGDGTSSLAHVHDWDYENVTWTFTENASHSIYAKYTLTCKTDPTHTKEQTGSGTLMSTVAVDGDKFVYSHSNVKIDGNSVVVPNYTRNIADGIINQYELKAAVKVAGEYKLANDITGFYDNVEPVDGFVLDGQNHMIKYGTMNANNRVMFVAADQNTKFTLKNITLDGNNRAKWAVCAYTGNSGNNAGNVITLDTVTIQNFKSNDYVGAINAFGSSTWNLKDCTITGNTTVDDSDGLSGSAVWAGSKATINIDGGTYDEVYLHSYSGTGAVLNADGGATIDNLVLDLTKTDTLKANIGEATVGAITANDGIIPEEAVVMDPDKATVAAPEGYEWVDSDETGMKTLAHVHDWDYENVTWTFTENASHSIYAKYTLTCKTDPTHTKEQTGSGTLMSTVAVDGDKFVYSHSAVKIDGISVAVPNYTRNIADGIINQYELKAAVKVAGEYKLANDITGFYDNVKPVDGFVLDGQNHMIKYGTMNANNRVMFVAADQNTKFTLKNITLDGNNRAKWAVCAYTDNGGNNAGNVITLDTVTIQNFKSNDYVGAINAFGSSTWNLKDCTITGNTTVDDSDGLSGSAVWAGSKATINIDGGTYDEVYLHSYSGTGAVLNADGGATIDNLVLDLTKTDTLKANIDEATVGAITSNEGTIPEEAVVMDPEKATVAAPEGYKWVDSDETGMKTLAQIVYVAQIGDTKYETLAEAFAAAVDGDIITVLADSAGNGIKVAAGKFATNGLTVDFNGHTYTVNANTVGSTGTETQGFQLLKNNKITFENGTINGDSRATATLKFLIQNYSNLTLDNMNLELVGKYFNQYTLSNNNGNIVINDSTINAPDYTWAGLTPTQVNSYAFDVCRYASYPSVNVTVTGNSTINGDVQVDAGNGDPKNGFSLTLESGTLTGDIVLTDGAKTAINADPEKANVTKANTFTQEAPEGYEWVDNGDGTSTLGHVHDYSDWAFNWTQDANGDWDCDTLTLTCSCGDTQTYPVTSFFGTSAVTVTANADGSFTYTVTKKVDGVTYTDTEELDANGVINSVKQLKAAAKAGGEWELGKDIDGAFDVQCANGFVLDGMGYTVTRSTNVDTNPVFRINSNPAEVTLKNLIIDGIEGRSNTKAAIATRQSNPSAGNVLNLENVHIENYDISATNNGAVLAWGQATVNLKDSTVTTDSTYDVWAGAAATVNIDGGTYGKVYLNGGTSKATVDGGATVVTATYGASAQSQVAVENGTVRNIALADGVELAKENFIAKTPETALTNVPAGYDWVDSQTTGMKTLDKAPTDLFTGHSITLRGDVSLNFFIDTAAIDNYDPSVPAKVVFTYDGTRTAEVDFANAPVSDGVIMATIKVPAAFMAHNIHAVVYYNGEAQTETDDYSIQQYAETLIEHPEYTPAGKNHADLAKLMKEMLNYGAKAQTVFAGQVKEQAAYDDLTGKYDYHMAPVTVDDIQAAIEAAPENRGKTATDLSTVKPEANATFYTSSVVFLSESTLKIVFKVPGGSTIAGQYDGSQKNTYYWVQEADIAAAQLDTLQEFTVGDATFYYSALDYAKVVLNGGNAAAQDLVSALYLYNQAANVYFGAEA